MLKKLAICSKVKHVYKQKLCVFTLVQFVHELCTQLCNLEIATSVGCVTNA